MIQNIMKRINGTIVDEMISRIRKIGYVLLTAIFLVGCISTPVCAEQITEYDILNDISAEQTGEPVENDTSKDTDENITEDTKENVIPVTDIDIADYESTLEVNSTMSLSVTVLPENATDTGVTYRSQNPAVATVNAAGEIKGVSTGTAAIEVSAGDITKTVSVQVVIKTKAIQLNSSYVVIRPGETFSLHAQASPAGSGGNITFQSMDSKVAAVNSSGTITGKANGNTTILVKNSDIQTAVTVIVNQSGQGSEDIDDTVVTENTEEMAVVIDQVIVEDYPVITSDILQKLYINGEKMKVIGNQYRLFLDGKDIVNADNELSTDLAFHEETNGFSFVLNDGKPLPGQVTINFPERVTDEKYLYLYNEAKGTYQFIDTLNINSLTLTQPGKYLVTSKKMNRFHMNGIWIGGGGVVILLGAAVYIFMKKKYWFW